MINPVLSLLSMWEVLGKKTWRGRGDDLIEYFIQHELVDYYISYYFDKEKNNTFLFASIRIEVFTFSSPFKSKKIT